MLQVLDSDSSKIIEAVRSTGVVITEAMRLYVDYIVSNMKAIGTWDLSTAVYGFVGGTADAHKWNWKDLRDLDAAYRLKQGQFSTITTVDNNLGVSFAGTYNYLQTSISPPLVGLTKDNFHLSIYNRTGSDFAYEIGNQITAQGSLALGVNRGGPTVGLPAGTGNLFTATASPNSLIILNSTSSVKADIYGKGLLKNSYTTSRTGALDNSEITLGALGNNSTPSFESAKQIQFASIGLGFTQSQSLSQLQIIGNAQNILNRA